MKLEIVDVENLVHACGTCLHSLPAQECSDYALCERYGRTIGAGARIAIQRSVIDCLACIALVDAMLADGQLVLVDGRLVRSDD